MQNFESNTKKKTKNTKGLQFYNSDRTYGSTLVLDYWQAFATVKIHPQLPEDRRSEKSKYDYDKSLGVVLTIERVYDLLQATKSVAFEIIENHNYNFTPAGVILGRNKNQLLQIEPLSSLEGMPEEAEGIVISIYSDIDPELGTTNNYIKYILGKASYIKAYDNKTGMYEKSDEFETQFMIFIKYLEQSLEALTMAKVHAQALHDMYSKDIVKDSLYEIKQKLGISSNTSNNYRNNNSNGFYQNNNFKENGSPSFDSGAGSPNMISDKSIINGGIIMGDRLNLDD